MQKGLAYAIRWLFPLWFGILYGWGIWNLRGASDKPACRLTEGGFWFSPCPSASATLGIFTGCMLGYVALFWWVHSRYWPGWSPAWYFGAQLAVIGAVSFVLPQVEIILVLSLALIFDALSCRPAIRVGVVLVCATLTLFALIIVPGTQKWGGNWSLVLNNLFGPLAIGVFAIGYFSIYQQGEQARAQRESAFRDLAEAHQQLQVSAARIEELTRQTERQRLARELHDTLAQGLVGVMMQLQAAESRLQHARYERARDAVQQAIRQVSAALTEARSVIGDLREAPTSFCAAAQDAVVRFRAITGTACTCQIGDLDEVPPVIEDQLLRVLTEGLMNVARHAQASQVWVTATRQIATIVLEVRDNGVGFDPAATQAAGHYGLLGLRERARLIGGQVEIHSAPGSGATLRLLVPLYESMSTEQHPEAGRI